MPPTKIQDHAELVRWFEEGRSYDWMREEYERKYNLQVTSSMFSNFRAREGLERRSARNVLLVPWAVKPEHRFAFPLAMLRAEGRRRAGLELKVDVSEQLTNWKRRLLEERLVVHYEPESEQGWWYVPRRMDVDSDLIYEPETPTTTRGSRD